MESLHVANAVAGPGENRDPAVNLSRVQLTNYAAPRAPAPAPKQNQSLYVPLRVQQMDSQILDNELQSMLLNQLVRVLSFVKGNVIERLRPELEAIVGGVMYSLSVYADGASYGSRLQSLTYHDVAAGGETSLITPSHNRRLAHGILTVGGRWVWMRLQFFVKQLGYDVEDEERANIARISNGIETTYRIASLINFLIFLYNGRYRTLVDRLLRMRLVYMRIAPRYVSFEFMNRQLVWQTFTEFVIFILPLVNMDRVVRYVSRTWRMARSGRTEVTRASNLSDTQCPHCSTENIVMPHSATPCGHIFCYYCLKSNLMADSFYGCPRCQVTITGLERSAGGSTS